MRFHGMFETPEIHAANPPESWTVLRIQDGSRVTWQVQTEPDQDYYHRSTFSTKRDAEAALTSGPLFDFWHAQTAYFASETYAGVLAQKVKQATEARRKIERAGLSVDQMATWLELSAHKDPNNMAGALQDFLTELLDWFNSERPLSIDSLNDEEARGVYKQLSEERGYASDVHEELHRMKYLHIGIERSAVEVLEELAERERYAA